METIPHPTKWEVQPDAYYGLDIEGRHYFGLSKQVYRVTALHTSNQATTWISTLAGFETSALYKEIVKTCRQCGELVAFLPIPRIPICFDCTDLNRRHAVESKKLDASAWKEAKP